MTRFLLVALLVLLAASAASAGHRSLFGLRTKAVIRERVVARERVIERTPIRDRLRGGAGCQGITAGGCIGTVQAAPVVAAGCSGWTGPGLVMPPVKVVPQAMPAKPGPQLESFSYWTITRDGLVKRQGVRTAIPWKK